MSERKPLEPVAWITRQVLAPNQTITGNWNPLLVSRHNEGDTWSPVYTADQIREAVERVRQRDPGLDCGCWYTFPSALLRELGMGDR